MSLTTPRLLTSPATSPLQSAELAGQVDSLLKAVEATNIFESEMARRFEGAPVDLGDPSGSEEAEAMGAPRPADDSTPASRVRARYERRARERQRATEGESPERRKEQVGQGTAGYGQGVAGWLGMCWWAGLRMSCADERQGNKQALAKAGNGSLPEVSRDASPIHPVPQRHFFLALQEHATSAAVAKTNFRGSISAVFAPYLRCVTVLLGLGGDDMWCDSACATSAACPDGSKPTHLPHCALRLTLSLCRMSLPLQLLPGAGGA